MSAVASPARPWPELLPGIPGQKDLPCSEEEARNWSRTFRPLPTHEDLPETDGRPVENTYQYPQSTLLTDTLSPVLDRFHPDGNYLIGTGTAIYWLATKDPFEGCKAPDWYYVPNVPRLRDGEFRKSYVIWEEYARPLLLVEYVSGNGSEERDDTPGWGKFWVYEQAIQAAYYAIWDVRRRLLDVYELVRGRYRPLEPDTNGRFRIPPMEVDLGVWDGLHFGATKPWLRAWDWDGKLIPTSEERAEAEKQRAERLAAKLRELGLDPDAV